MSHSASRQIILDTETTGLSPSNGHRIVEIGALELYNLHPTGETFQVYLNPGREIPEESIRIHGITNERVAGEPGFSEVVEDFLAFVGDAPLVIHNAPFDMGFLNHELSLIGHPELTGHPVIDTLQEAKRRHPRQRNSLDALCKRYDVDNSHRTLHGALLDAEILAEVYVAMLGGHQTVLSGMEERWGRTGAGITPQRLQAPAKGGLIPPNTALPDGRQPLLARLSDQELTAHEAILDRLGTSCVWRSTAEA